MSSFFEAQQVRAQLKMKLSLYSWYRSLTIISDSEGYLVLVGVKRIDNSIRAVIPQVIDGVSIKTEIDN